MNVVSSETTLFEAPLDDPNDPPTATDDLVTALVGDPISVNVTLNDTDDDGSIDVSSVDLDPTTPGIDNNFVTANGEFTVDNAGVVTFTPSLLGSLGTTQIDYTVRDDIGDVSNVAVIKVVISAINFPPSILGQATTPINEIEDTPFTIQPADLTIVDLNTGDNFTVNLLPGTNYTISGGSIIPASNYNGALTVNVSVNDGHVDSNVYGVSVNLAPVNDPPSITGQVSTPLNETEDTPFPVKLTDLIISDPDAGDVFTVTLLPGTNYAISGSNIVPASNYNGPLTVNVSVNDSHVESVPFPLAITVAPANDPPVIGGQAHAINALEDTPFTIDPSDLVISDPFAPTPRCTSCVSQP